MVFSFSKSAYRSQYEVHVKALDTIRGKAGHFHADGALDNNGIRRSLYLATGDERPFQSTSPSDSDTCGVPGFPQELAPDLGRRLIPRDLLACTVTRRGHLVGKKLFCDEFRAGYDELS